MSIINLRSVELSGWNFQVGVKSSRRMCNKFQSLYQTRKSNILET